MPDKRTYSSRSEYLKKAVSLRRKAIKQRALNYMGKKCIFCHYNKYEGALEFHHKVAETKKFGISMRGMTRSWDKIESELKKCVLICSNCHAEVHDGITQLSEEILK